MPQEVKARKINAIDKVAASTNYKVMRTKIIRRLLHATYNIYSMDQLSFSPTLRDYLKF